MPSPPDEIAEVRLRRAGMADLDLLAPLVRDYHATEGIEQDPGAYARILRPLLEANDKGGIWLIDANGAIAGYVAICLCYSIEFGGVDAFVDELYVTPGARGRGVGSRALALAIDETRALGARTLHLEVDVDNRAARALYVRHGVALRERYQLMTRALLE
jgi:ribosomal protein S18 acetylase RimI-like enzyme